MNFNEHWGVERFMITAKEAAALSESFVADAMNNETVKSTIACIDELIERTAVNGGRSVLVPGIICHISEGESAAVMLHYASSGFSIRRDTANTSDYRRAVISW